MFRAASSDHKLNEFYKETRIFLAFTAVAPKFLPIT